VREAARAKVVELSVQKASTKGEIDAAFGSLVPGQAGAIVVAGDPFFTSQREEIVPLASRYAVPAVYLHLLFGTAGGLIVYGVDENDLTRQAAVYVGKILKGARPADLPVQQPTEMKLIVNLRTARALGLTVPQSILARADEVIE
jgi:putative ABC transport system substrate-binding protein